MYLSFEDEKAVAWLLTVTANVPFRSSFGIDIEHAPYVPSCPFSENPMLFDAALKLKFVNEEFVRTETL